MGSGSTEVALVKFSTYAAKEPGSSKPKPTNQFEVLDADWDAELGANALDMLLADHFAAQFDKKTGLGDVRWVVVRCWGWERDERWGDACCRRRAPAHRGQSRLRA